MTIKENRNIHHRTYDGSLSVRYLSCYLCEHIFIAMYEHCTNDPTLWPKRQLQMNGLKIKTFGTESGLDESLVEDPELSQLAIVAIRNIDDESYPYYVLRASSNVIRLRKPHQDKWGGIFEAGDVVIPGNYFKATDQTLFNQILIKRNKATVPARSIEYIFMQRNYQFDRFATSANFKIHTYACRNAMVCLTTLLFIILNCH